MHPDLGHLQQMTRNRHYGDNCCLFLDLLAVVLREPFLQLLRIGDGWKEVGLTSQVIHDDGSVVAAIGRRLDLLEVDQDGELLRWQEAPVDDGVVLPAIGAAHDDVLAGFLRVLLDQREGGVVKCESQVRGLEREEGSEEDQHGTDADDQLGAEHSEHQRSQCEVVGWIDDLLDHGLFLLLAEASEHIETAAVVVAASASAFVEAAGLLRRLARNGQSWGYDGIGLEAMHRSEHEQRGEDGECGLWTLHVGDPGYDGCASV